MLFRLKMYRLFLKVAIYLLPFPAFELGWRAWSLWAIFLGRPLLYSQRGHFAVVLIATFVWAFMAEHYRVTNVDELFRERTGARAACSAVTATAVVLLGALYFARNDVFPRGLFVYSILVLLILTLFAHSAFRLLCRRNLWLGRPTRLLIVGSDQFAVNAATRLLRLSFAPCQIAGYVRLPGQEVDVTNSKVYDFVDMEGLCSADEIDEAVIAIHPTQFSQIPVIIKAMEKLSVPARAIVDLGEGVVVRERLFQLGRMQMLDLTTTPTDLPDYVLLKRAFDIVFSLLIFIVASPLIVLIALLIGMTSPGPILFVQERVGLNGVPFRMYKFRTMRTGSRTDGDTKWTVQGDPRCTFLGRFLRKTSLDELPQFINVLKGDMSVVGPRPERPHFVTQFLNEIGHYNHRHCLRVGITGWAQVNGWRGNTSIQKRLEYDLYYLQNWTFIFDLRIILLTVVSALAGENAY